MRTSRHTAPTLLALSLALALAACSSKQEGTTHRIKTDESTKPAANQAAALRLQDAGNPHSADAMLSLKEEPPASPVAGGSHHRAEKKVVKAKVLASGVVAEAVAVAPEDGNRERYGKVTDHPIKQVSEAPVSTFSIDVDTGSYANVRRLLNGGQLPPKDAVRVEEMINYFPYSYPSQANGRPFAVHTEVAPSPWSRTTHLLKIGIKAQELAKAELPPANLVFLVDVSGSMNEPNKLPLLQQSLKLLVKQLRPQDKVSLVIYASGTGVILPPTSGSDSGRILAAIDQLKPGGSTAGEAGIRLAYQMAHRSFVKGGINRILLATDGDFNVGIADTNQLKEMVETERRGGVSLSTLGFGTNNYNEALMEQIADVGNGNYSYIDTLNEGRKVLVDEMTSTLATVAKDVKIQVEFNPAAVSEYRLIGYENRQLQREDFNNDKIDAGEIGAGHTVTALYEITLKGQPTQVDPLRYGTQPKNEGAKPEELAFLRLRYKAPDGDTSKLMETPLHQRDILPSFDQASTDLRFAAAVAGFGQRLRGGRHTANLDYAAIKQLAQSALGDDRWGYRGEFMQLVDQARSLDRPNKPGMQSAQISR